MTMLVSYAQNFEDVMLWRALKHISNGNYVDIGAQDPVVDSVSLLFYEHGWRGMHVEPSSHYAEMLRQARPEELVIQAAVSSEARVLPFFEIAGGGLSTCDKQTAKKHVANGIPVREILVPGVTLDDIFARNSAKEVHWLKIDVEGAEKQVLQGWRTSEIRPWIILLESTLPCSQVPSHQKWESLVLHKGYKFAYFDGLNRFYVAAEHSDLIAAFAVGPNVFDGFGLSGVAWSSWCKVVNDKRQAIEALRYSELLEFENRLQQTQRDYSEQLRLATDATEQKVIHCAGEIQDLTKQLLQGKQYALDAARALAASEERLGAKLATSQGDSVRLARELAEREREFATKLTESDQALRIEISTAVADLVRLRELLDDKESELAAVRHVAAQEALKISFNEREFKAQMLVMRQLAEEKAEFIQAREMQIRSIVEDHARRENNFGEMLRSLQQELTLSLRASSQREQEFAVQLATIQKQVGVESAGQNRLIDEQRLLLTSEYGTREKALTESLQSFQQEIRSIEQERWQRERAHSDQMELAHQEWQRERQALVMRQQEIIAEVRETQKELLSTHESLSWRITAPLRNLFGKGISPSITNMPVKRHRYEISELNASVGSPESKTIMTNAPMLESSARPRTPTIAELLSYDGKSFVDNAFHALLGRPPDHEASVFYLDRIRSGTTKKQVLDEIVDSDEAKAYSRSTAGL